MYEIRERNIQTVNEKLFEILDIVARYRENISSVKELEEVQEYLKQIEDGLTKSIEIED